MGLQEVRERVEAGIGGDGVFGGLSGTMEEMLEAARSDFRNLAKACHPDLVSSAEKELATQTFKQLRDIYSLVTDQIKTGAYGRIEVTTGSGASRSIGVVATKLRTYTLSQIIATGEVSRIFKATYKDSAGFTRDAAVKIALDERDNGLIENEQSILKKLSTLLDPKAAISLPKLIDTVFTADRKAGSVLELVDGYDFQRLLDHPLYQNGLADPYHIGWILERQLALLGHLHKNGIVHGNIEPAHLMLVPHNHNVVLLDFCFAVDSPSATDRVRIFTPDHSAPEIRNAAPPHPRMDLYGVGKSMVYLFKGDVRTGRVPRNVARPYVQLIRQLIQPDPAERAEDAWKVVHDLVGIRDELGRSDFIPLPI